MDDWNANALCFEVFRSLLENESVISLAQLQNFNALHYVVIKFGPLFKFKQKRSFIADMIRARSIVNEQPLLFFAAVQRMDSFSYYGVNLPRIVIPPFMFQTPVLNLFLPVIYFFADSKSLAKMICCD